MAETTPPVEDTQAPIADPEPAVEQPQPPVEDEAVIDVVAPTVDEAAPAL